MSDESKLLNDKKEGPRSLFALVSLSIAVGVLTGVVAASFRLFLHRADIWRTSFIVRAHSWGVPGFLLVVLSIALIASLAAWIVFRFAPDASGSGIPYVEHQLKTGWFGNPVSCTVASLLKDPPMRITQRNPLNIIIVKFFGGLLAIGGGLTAEIVVRFKSRPVTKQ